MAQVGYIRVSSIGQNVERQLEGLTLDETFTDTTSGKSLERPALQEMLGSYGGAMRCSSTPWTGWPVTLAICCIS